MKKVLIVLLSCLVFFACENSLKEIKPDHARSSKSKNKKKNKNKNFANIVFESTVPINDVCGEIGRTDLLAGQTTKVGEIIVSTDGSSLSVTYDISVIGWKLVETHLAIAVNPEDFPINNGGNPKIGLFEFSGESMYNIDLSDYGNPENVFIAAHGVVECVDGLEAVEIALPGGTLDMSVSFDGEPSYFGTTITNGGSLNDKYMGYCLDLDHNISKNVTYAMTPVSSYSDDASLLSCLVDKPQNLDLINYILNQDYDGGGQELQAAIWTIIDDETVKSPSEGIQWDQDIVNFIVADAIAHGEGFEPACDDVAAIILDPGCSLSADNATIKTQVNLIVVPLECGSDCEETAWGKGTQFPGNNWAMYFKYCIAE